MRNGSKRSERIVPQSIKRYPSPTTVSICYLWDHNDDLASLVDVWEASNRDDLFSVTSLKH
jgi:hypothetical protein